MNEGTPPDASAPAQDSQTKPLGDVDLVEMYLSGVSVRRVEDITQALWGTRVSPSTVSELNQKIAVQIEA
jgi:transposase-like protein